MFVVSLVRWWNGSESDSQGCERVQGRSGYREEYKKRILDEFGDEPEEGIPEDIRCRFRSASSFVQSSTDKIPQDSLLILYAHFKVATCGTADKSERPSVFDQKARRKFDAWAAIGEMPKAIAMEKYADIVDGLNLGWEPGTQQETAGFGLRPSRPKMNSEDDSSSSSMDPISRKRALWFVACKADDVSTAGRLLEDNPQLLETADEHLGMTALHWAIDSGADQIMEWLIKKGADVNCVDPEGNTPLHFAAYCARENAARFLLSAGANKSMTNSDGLTPLQAADSDNIIYLLR